jgi:hypothetical protein
VSTFSVVALLVTAFFGLGLIRFLRMPKEWQPPYSPWLLINRRQTTVIAWILAVGAFAIFVLSLVAPSLLTN